MNKFDLCSDHLFSHEFGGIKSHPHEITMAFDTIIPIIKSPIENY